MFKVKVFRFDVEVTDSNTGQSTYVKIEGTDLVTMNQVLDRIRSVEQFQTLKLDTSFSTLVLDQTNNPKPMTIVRRKKEG